MKKLVILSAIAAGSLFVTRASAQVSIHFGINIPVRRVYVPTPPPPPPPVVQEPVYDDDEYDAPVNCNDDYYYLPEVEAYYNVGAGCYYYNDGSRWVSCSYLPGAYRYYNWRTAVRYEVRAPRPYLHHDIYRSRWGGWNGDRNNWGHRFDRMNTDRYAYRGYDNRGWGDNRNRGDWGRRPNPYDYNRRGGWDNNDHNNRGWGNGPQPGNVSPDNHGGGWGNRPQPSNNPPANSGDRDNRGGWGNGQPSNNGGRDRGNSGDRFAQNMGGRGGSRF